MKIAIIGGGVTGLSCAYYLSKHNHKIDLYESTGEYGGLAKGIGNKKWNWYLDIHYHHIFKTDKYILKLAKQINHKIHFSRPKTSTFIDGKIYQIDSVKSLLNFKEIPLIDRARTGLIIFLIKMSPYLNFMEQIEADKFINITMGNKSWKVIWGPLMKKKFGKYYKQIPASWFWARLKTRTSVLGYPDKGFQAFINNLVKKIKRHKGKLYLNSEVTRIEKVNELIEVFTKNGKYEKYDLVINTLPFNHFCKIVKNLPKKYINNLNKLDGLSASNLIITLQKAFFNDGTYWLNVNEDKFPFLCIVEHTNFVNKKHYGDDYLIYIGNYFDKNSQIRHSGKEQLLKKYYPYLTKINPQFKSKYIKDIYLNKSTFSQPILKKYYSRIVPNIQSPIRGIYTANIQQIYPWDRGTNYSVQIADKVSKIIQKEYFPNNILKQLLINFVRYFLSITKAYKYYGQKDIKEVIDMYDKNGLTKLFTEIRFWDAPLVEIEKITPKRGNIVDLGCGEGILTNYLALKSKMRRLIGIEIDKNRVSIADKGLKNVNYIHGNILNVKIPKTDVIILSNVLHHLPSYSDQNKILIKCKKSLNKNGLLIIADINKGFSFKYLLGWFVDAVVFPFIFEKKLINLDFFHRSEKQWIHLLETIGFSVKSKRGFSFRPFPDILLVAKN